MLRKPSVREHGKTGGFLRQLNRLVLADLVAFITDYVSLAAADIQVADQRGSLSAQGGPSSFDRDLMMAYPRLDSVPRSQGDERGEGEGAS